MSCWRAARKHPCRRFPTARLRFIRAMSQRNDDPPSASRPFDKNRDGFVMAEGAAMLLLRNGDHAQARGARIYGEILSHACTNDASHMTQPRPDGVQAARCISLALTRAGLAPTDIGYINAHGSSTPLNDSTETLALKQAFGDYAYQVPIQRHQRLPRPRPRRHRRVRGRHFPALPPRQLAAPHPEPHGAGPCLRPELS